MAKFLRRRSISKTRLMIAIASMAALSAPAALGQQPSVEAPTTENTFTPTESDSVMTFRFYIKRNGFYVTPNPLENKAEIKRMYRIVNQYRDLIDCGAISVYVFGYNSELPTIKQNLAIAKIRSNRVKSELITNRGLKEANFVTRNRAEEFEPGVSSAVVVRIPQPKPPQSFREMDYVEEPPVTIIKRAPDVVAEPEIAVAENMEGCRCDICSCGWRCERMLSPEGALNYRHWLSLRANLLNWATLTPDLGLEWRINKNFGLLAHGTWTYLDWKNSECTYRRWEVSPQFRWYIGKNAGVDGRKLDQWFLGLQYTVGEYNVKLSTVGKRGSYQGGSLVGGYQFPLGKGMKALWMDISLGLGATRYSLTEYETNGGDPVIRETRKEKSYFGPNQASVSLIWRLN